MTMNSRVNYREASSPLIIVFAYIASPSVASSSFHAHLTSPPIHRRAQIPRFTLDASVLLMLPASPSLGDAPCALLSHPSLPSPHPSSIPLNSATIAYFLSSRQMSNVNGINPTSLCHVNPTINVTDSRNPSPKKVQVQFILKWLIYKPNADRYSNSKFLMYAHLERRFAT